MQFTINHESFHCDRDENGEWVWISDTAECEGVFLSAWEAQQDAIHYVQNEIDDERVDAEQRESDRPYGSYDDQVRREYDYQIRH